VSPKKHSSMEKVAKVTKKVKEVKVKDVKVKIEPVDADEATENFIKALKAIQKKPVVKSTSAKATLARRSAHVSIGGRVSASPTGRACLSPSF